MEQSSSGAAATWDVCPIGEELGRAAGGAARRRPWGTAMEQSSSGAPATWDVCFRNLDSRMRA